MTSLLFMKIIYVPANVLLLSDTLLFFSLPGERGKNLDSANKFNNITL